MSTIIPIYDETDIAFAIREGDEQVSNFSSFISQLITEDFLVDNPTEKGIASVVNTKGTKALSEKQFKVLEIIVSRFENKTCSVCGTKIPLNEVLDFDFNDSLCSYHKYQADKAQD